MDIFFNKFSELLKPGLTVLDLGAGSGRHAKYMAKNGLNVVAVDRAANDPHVPNITWHTMEIQNWLSSIPSDEKYDAILMRNIIQFFSSEYIKDTLLPTLLSHLKPDGIVAIETFFRDPEPAFPKRFNSYWTVEDLKDLFPQWKVIFATESAEDRSDLHGTGRKFYLTDIIVTRK